MLDDAAGAAQPRGVCLANLAGTGADAIAQAEVAGLRAVIARGRWNHAQRDAVGRDDDAVCGSGLAPIGGAGAGQLAIAFGPNRAAVNDHVPSSELATWAHLAN